MTVIVRPARPSPTAYWWKGRPNFGDLLTPLLMAHFVDLPVTHTNLGEADMIGVGSLLHSVPSGWRGVIAGSGKLFDREEPNTAHANILGLRGPLSARGRRGDLAIGDPGLLANELVQVPGRVYDIGIVPHWSDNELQHRFTGLKGSGGKLASRIIIRPEEDPLEVIRKIGMCHKIVSSSLHGIILADAFGIPRRIEHTSRFDKEGGMFKFRDHNAAVGLKHEVGLTQTPTRHLVQARQHEVYDMLKATRTALMEVE